MLKALSVGGFAVAVLIAGTQTASASLMMSLTDGTTTVSCNSDIAVGGSNCTALTWETVSPTKVEFAGSIGFFTTTGSAGSTVASTTGQAELDVTNLVITNTNSITHTLVIDVTGFGYTVPPNPGAASPMTLTGSQSLTSAFNSTSSSTTATSYANAANLIGASTNANDPCTLSIALSNSCDESAITWARGDGPFSLRTLLSVTLGSGQSINLNETTLAQGIAVTPPSEVPEPTSLLLLGSGLLVVGRKLRKSVGA